MTANTRTGRSSVLFIITASSSSNGLVVACIADGGSRSSDLVDTLCREVIIGGILGGILVFLVISLFFLIGHFFLFFVVLFLLLFNTTLCSLLVEVLILIIVHFVILVVFIAYIPIRKKISVFSINSNDGARQSVPQRCRWRWMLGARAIMESGDERHLLILRCDAPATKLHLMCVAAVASPRSYRQCILVLLPSQESEQNRSQPTLLLPHHH
ncbi:hypothetical protein B0T17DRAFT_96769 [Bombardia bombarda]|uniref:Transmembrane protein n=1 Tax=Bombardia bombarda TaxID=252184 RepID=A0AA39XMZ8_9PEZI|nr:hypothetical protein B0T17DRAFT_96769 [Bombardia bombarda]